MNTTELLSSIDSEIATLQQVRAILACQDGHRSTPGRKPAEKVGIKGKMSAAGRARIAAAQRARWAKLKAGKKPAKKVV